MNKDTTMTYIKDIALKLYDPKMFGGVSLMVGAGFSKNAEAIGNRVSPPDWSELADAMYEELYPEPKGDIEEIKKWNEKKTAKTSGRNTLRLAEEYIAFWDRNKMDTLIENNISDVMFVPSELHRKLLKLNWRDIFTTNYDTLLERTCDEIFPKKEYKVILSQDNLPGSNNGLARIIKLHGSISGVRPYIISEEDYRCYPRKYAAFVNTVQQSLIETTLCMIGFSGDDPNFLSWHGWLHDNLGENCPQIYLIGLFGTMNDSEKEVLRKRKIALVDLETLLDGSEHNKYKEAYNKFFSVIEESKELCFKDSAPYINQDPYQWNEKDENAYVANILTFSNKILEQEGDYVLLPQAKRNEYRNYFSNRFYTLIFKCKNITLDYIHTLSNVIRLQMMCLTPLDDDQADKLKSICQSAEERNLDVKPEWRLQIDLYLLQMYRIDADEEKYQQISIDCEKYLDKLSDSGKAVYWIELAKHAASVFDAEEMKCRLNKIEHTDIKNEIAKAGLYLQIGEYDVAERILKECLDELRKKRLDVTRNASYKSYLSLCYAASGKWMIQDNNYSDLEYKDNEYQTRAIILDLENELREEILNTTVKDDTQANVFEVNRNRGNSITFGINKLQQLSFEFILMLDVLCLPIFSDQSVLLPTVMEKILHTSNNTYWKFSFMVRSNNKDVIERILSRRGMAMHELAKMEILYCNIWNCVKKTTYKNFDFRYSFLSFKNALDVLSRMAVYLADVKIIELIKYIVNINCDDLERHMSDISNILQRLSTRFNSSIGSELKNEIFASDNKLCLASYFYDVDMILNENTELYSNAVRLANSNDIEKRDNGIAQLLILWRSCKDENFSELMKDAIWKKGIDTLPETKKFNVVIWEELPHPAEVDFAGLYKDFISIGLKNLSDRNVFQFINLFYLTSPMSNDKYARIKWDADCLTDILNAVINRISKIKENSGIEVWGFDTEKLQKRYLNEFVVMLYALGQVDLEIAKTLPMIEKAIGLLNENGINGNAFESIKMVVSGNHAEAMGKLKDAFWSNEESVLSEASLGIQGAFYILRQNNENIDIIKDVVLEIMQTLQYSDIKYVRSIWNILRQLIRRVFYDDDIYQAKLAEVFEKCIRSYSSRGKKGDKYYFDAMYNCNKTLKSYCDQVIESGYSLNDKMEKTISYVKSLGIFELSAIWE